MNRLRSGNKELIRDLNRMLVLNQIRVNEPISRSELSRQVGLGPSTITNIIDELLQGGLVTEIGHGSSSGGRKPVLLELDGEYGLVIGIKIEKKQLILCCSNVKAEILGKLRVPYEKGVSNEKVNRLIIEGIEQLLDTHLDDRWFCGIGIAASGLVDKSTNTVVYSPILSWEDYDFSPVAEYFDVPIYIDNDANVFTLAHMWVGLGRGYQNFIGVILGAGVGAGIVINGQLYRGEFGGAGELGHTIVEHRGSTCHCGQRGCLEMYASEQFILGEIDRLRRLGIPMALDQHGEVSTDSIYEAARTDDTIQGILTRQGENLGVGLKNMVNLLNPAAIILGGEGLRGGDFLLRGVRETIQTNFFAKHQRQLEFHTCNLGEDVFLIGACSLVVEELFRAPIYRERTELELARQQ